MVLLSLLIENTSLYFFFFVTRYIKSVSLKSFNFASHTLPVIHNIISLRRQKFDVQLPL